MHALVLGIDLRVFVSFFAKACAAQLMLMASGDPKSLCPLIC